jgi:hemerythrin
MPICAWDPRLATGDPVVDHQHQTLFSMVNGLHEAIASGATRPRIQRILEELSTYTFEHFAAEERLMARVGYPAMAGHVCKHQDMAKQAIEIIDGYRSGRLTVSLTLPQFLADWVRHHIAEEDLGMITWIRAQRG